MRSNKPTPPEFIIESATYKNFLIMLTNLGRFITRIYLTSYPVHTLDEAKKMIDELEKNRNN